MKYLFLTLFIFFPYLVFSQGFDVKIGSSEFPIDRIPDQAIFYQPVKKFSIKKRTADKTVKTFTIQIGEEEHKFSTDGRYHQVEFSHDVRGLVASILDERRNPQGKPFKIKKVK